MTDRTINIDYLNSNATLIRSAELFYSEYARQSDVALDNAKTAAATVIFGAGATVNELRAVATEAFTMAAHISNEITRLQQEKMVSIAAVSSADFAYLGDLSPEQINSRIETEKRSIAYGYDPLIQSLQNKRQAIVDFLNGELNVYQGKLQSMIDQSSPIFRAIDSVKSFNAGYAFIGLRLYYASETIKRYCRDVENNEEQAMQDFLRSLPTVVPSGQRIDPNDPIGIDWRATDAALIALAQSGYQPNPDDVPHDVPQDLQNLYEVRDATQARIAACEQARRDISSALLIQGDTDIDPSLWANVGFDIPAGSDVTWVLQQINNYIESDNEVLTNILRNIQNHPYTMLVNAA